MADEFQHNPDTVISPARSLSAVTPSDTTPLALLAKALYVGTGGNVAVRAADDAAPVTLSNVPDGTILPVRAAYVYATGTTASGIVAFC